MALAAARGRPGAVDIGSAGEFTVSHLALERFSTATGIRVVHVPFNGGNDLINAVIKRQVEIAFVALPAAIPYLNGGRFRVLGIAEKSRSVDYPHIPTIAELGLPDFEAWGWYGLFAPPGTAPERVAALRAAVAAVVKDPAYIAETKKINMEIQYTPPDTIARLVDEILRTPAPVVERARKVLGVANR